MISEIYLELKYHENKSRSFARVAREAQVSDKFITKVVGEMYSENGIQDPHSKDKDYFLQGGPGSKTLNYTDSSSFSVKNHRTVSQAIKLGFLKRQAHLCHSLSFAIFSIMLCPSKEDFGLQISFPLTSTIWQTFSGPSTTLSRQHNFIH